MSLRDDIQKDVKEIFQTAWTTRVGKVIPSEDSLKLSNDGIQIQGTVLYADLAKSTQIVKTHLDTTAAEIYKSFLLSICKVIRSNGGEITAFDGDRVMAVFMGNNPNTTAAKTALQINYTIKNIVQAELNLFYKESNFKFEYGVGVDTSKILVAKTGIRGSNDLVWIGNAANIAAKLCSLRGTNENVWISETVYNSLLDNLKFGGTHRLNMWSKSYNSVLDLSIYGSSWTWSI